MPMLSVAYADDPLPRMGTLTADTVATY